MAEVEARLEETTLIGRCQQGDLAAFDELVSIHASRVFNLAYRMLGSQQDAEDAAQEAFLRAFSALRQFRRGATFSTWLYRITVNTCLDELKRRKRRPQPFTSVYGEFEEESENQQAAASPTPFDQQDPEELLTRRLEQEQVQRALAILPTNHRAVVVMCDIEGLSYEEAAAALKTGLGTVKSRLHRARQRLKELLTRERGMARMKDEG